MIEVWFSDSPSTDTNLELHIDRSDGHPDKSVFQLVTMDGQGSQIRVRHEIDLGDMIDLRSALDRLIGETISVIPDFVSASIRKAIDEELDGSPE